jgi:hypothetical protein
LLQGLLDAEAALQGRALQAGHILGGVQQVQAGLVGKCGQRLVQWLGGQVELHLAGLGVAGRGGAGGLDQQWPGQRGQGGAGQQGVFEAVRERGRSLHE